MFNKTNFVRKFTVPFLLLAFDASSYAQPENKIFSEVCRSCHTGGFKGWLSGAPNVKDKNKWKKYIKRGSIEKMRDILIKGSEDHKAKGGCDKCSNDDIVGAIDYIMLLVK
ncbi:MAG: c-type cytochrome [bacterium]|nr:c-type cytochrome [bacterium]